MKKLLLPILCGLLWLPMTAQEKTTSDKDSSAMATPPANNPTTAESDPEVIITGHEKKGVVDSTVIRAAIDHYYKTRIEGFQQSGLPRFIITGRERKFLLGIGGFVNFRASYDFAGAVDNRDFITYDIPIPASEATRQRLGMDATSSRLFFKAIANSTSLGQVESYIEMDFRGTGGGLMRMRYAYISFKGVLFGRGVTTFCDLSAAPTTVDTEGPNAYTFNFNDMVRYTHKFPGDNWSAAISAEAPLVSMVALGNVTSVSQRLPDVPIYVQYKWGKSNHARFSSILREMRYYNSETAKAHSKIGWGMQLSGSAKLPYDLTFFMQAVYGKGIARYLQDISGVGLDLVSDPRNGDNMETLPMAGWFGALQLTLSSKLFICSGYSEVEIFRPNYYPQDDSYRHGQYFFSNIFMNVGSSCTLGLEYIHGARKNTDGQTNNANRIQGMIQYNF